MAKAWKVMRRDGGVKGKDFGVFRTVDVQGLKSPVLEDEAPCMIANCTRGEAQVYADELERGATVEDVRARRQYYRNMMHSGMN